MSDRPSRAPARPASHALSLAAACALSACASIAGPPPALLADASPGQRAWAASCTDTDDWDKAGPPFRVYGDTWYVGTCGITALLVARPDGLTLIDTGTDGGADVVLANIRSLGFDPRDVRTIVMSHEHFDHIGGLAKMQAATGATIAATLPAIPVLRTGRPGASDPQHGAGHPPFPPVTGRIRALPQGRATVGPLTALRTPGHTSGALSWTWRECENGRCRQIVFADSLSPISGPGYRFSDHPAFVAEFRRGLTRLAALPCDIVLAPHPAAARMRERLSGGLPLVDPSGCRTFATTAGARLDARLAKEAAGG